MADQSAISFTVLQEAARFIGFWETSSTQL